MNLLEIVSRTQRLFGDTSGIHVFKTDIISWLNDGQVDIARKTECLQSHKETNSVAQDGSYSLPDNFLFMRKVSYNSIPLLPTTLENADRDWPDRDKYPNIGQSMSYYIWNNILYLYPVPEAVGSGNLDIWYVRTPIVISQDGEIPEVPVIYHEALVRFCLSRAKELDDNFSESAAIMKDYESMIVELKYETRNQQQDSYSAVRLCPGDEF